MSTKPTPAIARDANGEHLVTIRPDAVAALDRSIAREQEFDAARATDLATRPRAITTERGA